MNVTDHIEQSARAWVKQAIDNGVMSQPIPETMVVLRSRMAEIVRDNPGAVSPVVAGGILGRIESILTEIDVGGPDVVLGKYHDCLPDDLRAQLFTRAKAVLRDCGVKVEEFRDASGEVFLRCVGLEKLGIPAGEMARIHAMAGDLPEPVGELRRVH